jgi:hypothetical protein
MCGSKPVINGIRPARPLGSKTICVAWRFALARIQSRRDSCAELDLTGNGLAEVVPVLNKKFCTALKIPGGS